ncbi:putative extracellular dihydrogeodin oxidase/laccase [Aspergillus nomiae NRRL 13137]|uniref:Putative extracellular dihydrogeodin oxidase/laccase n=1 Tax=Aspergillus nomiae NRRL (strain ATCC 15546 / NRRL 13137 / CBS 260.88 / M93) TaxID=1509407 RepID=A0A0L1JHF9_ASPN3|nr:putative extracellular dihydrogeodin oxidase/laccase [Aspergillus nomiae NRRL 13137]KNG91191.1 putative extracellular dihydrogeodin oxidase/laccase [Aspergillus nomiae NRRL 13137]
MTTLLLPLILVALAASLQQTAPLVASPFSSGAGLLSRGVSGHEQFNINTDYYSKCPDTGVVREYWFDITNMTAAPDGVRRAMMLVNGQYPGPTIEVDWGDTVKVHVQNRLENNGTSIHFHGVRQFLNNQMDGAVSVTQCPIAPETSYTYTWKAEQYGTSFYHSHFSLQAWEGVFGGIIIHGPAAADYDEDLGVLFLNDWPHRTFNEMYINQISNPATPVIDTGLINMTNVWTTSDGETVGQRFKTEFVPGKKYRIRLVNAAMHAHFRFSIDDHNLTVIASDFVPIVPFATNNIAIGMGQRYDIIVQADQPVDNYWIRAVPQSACSNIPTGDNIKGIVHYIGAEDGEDPTTVKWDYGDDTQCLDRPMSDLVPWVALDAMISNTTSLNDAVAPTNAGSIFLWTIGGRAFNVSWKDPTLQHSSATGMNSTIPDPGAINLPEANRWVIFIIATNQGIPHPIHLHGHDFYILAQGIGPFSRSIPLQTRNPPRRDVALMPAESNGGYLVIAFPTNNPGAWLLHCHMGFHSSAGFVQQIVERQDEFWKFLNPELLKDTCEAWDDYAAVNPYGVQYRGTNGPYESGM